MRAELGGGQQETQDLRVRLGGPSGDEVKQEEHQDSSEEASEQVESRRAYTHGEEEQFSLGTQNCQGS